MAPRKTTKRGSTESDEEQQPATPPPPKKAKKAKNNLVNNDDDGSDIESSTKIPPNSFMDFIHDLKEYGKEKLNHKGKLNLSKIADGIPMLTTQSRNS